MYSMVLVWFLYVKDITEEVPENNYPPNNTLIFTQASYCVTTTVWRLVSISQIFLRNSAFKIRSLAYTYKISIRYSKSVLFRMYVYVVRTCIRCGTNVYLGGTKMGGTKRRWYEKPGILYGYTPSPHTTLAQCLHTTLHFKHKLINGQGTSFLIRIIHYN